MIREHSSKIYLVPSKVECDVCHEIYEEEWELQEFLHINDIGGYTSVFGDGTEYNCDVCQYCLRALFEKYMRFDDK